MKALDRKLWRDLRLMWSQALTIAMVVASGVGGFITSLSAVDSLARARDDFYAQGHFADVFASLKRAPQAVADQLRELPGVADVQATTEVAVRIALPGLSDPIVGHIIGIDARRALRMNQVSVSSGAALPPDPAPDAAIPVLVSEAFADAHRLKPGARIGALMNGRHRTLVMTGTALSPEYIFAGLWGMPDQRGFGVFWMDRALLDAAYDMEGAFNHVAIKLAPRTRERAVLDAVDARLSRYGAQQAAGREHQASHQMLDNEIKEQRVLGSVLPAIFLGVAAFLLNVVVSRLVATQREQIAAMKALGYANRAIAGHYLKLVLLIVSAGFVLGVGLGKLLGTLLTGLYADFFRFPRFEHAIAPGLLATGLLLTLAMGVLGALNAVAATVRLPPAEAMRPPAPGRFRRTLIERMGFTGLPPALGMILRNMERRPWRTALSIAGVAAAVAIVIMGNFFRDAIETIVDRQFHLSLRSDVTVWATDPLPDRARWELLRLPGVTAVESTRFVNVTLEHRQHRERTLIRGYPAAPTLYRIIDADARETRPAGSGLVLTDRLANKLELRRGDLVRVEVLEGRMRSFDAVVDGTVREMMGLNAYMERHALNRALGEGDISTGFVLGLERGAEAAVLEATRGLPRVAGAFSKASMLRNMQELSARNVRIMSTILTLFASVIAVGVVYNNARIALAERTWELASLRVLGFTRAEVSGLLLGELGLSIAVALPLGMLLGWALVHGVAGLLASDQFFFPVVIWPRTYGWATVAVLLAAAASALVVRRRIDRLDLVAALKTRE